MKQYRNFQIETDSLRELTVHRTALLPVACYHSRIDRHVHGRIPLHWHDELQWIRVEHGEGIFRVNDEELTLRAGEGVFINSGCLHGAEDRSQSGCTYLSLNVAPDFLLPNELRATYLYPYLGTAGVPYLHFDEHTLWGSDLLQGIGHIYRLLTEQPSFYETEIAMGLTRLWHGVIAREPEPKPDAERGQRSRRVKDMLNWIHAHYTEAIRLEDIAIAGGLSRSECCRYFKRFLGETPLGYVTDYRIEQAMTLLTGDANVTEAAYRTGFVSTSHFIEKFRLKTGMTPLAYKKKGASNR